MSAARDQLAALWDAILAYGAASEATGFDLTGKPDTRAQAEANRRDCLAKVETLLRGASSLRAEREEQIDAIAKLMQDRYPFRAAFTQIAREMYDAGVRVRGARGAAPERAPLLPDTFVERAIRVALAQPEYKLEGDTVVGLSGAEAAFIRQKYGERNSVRAAPEQEKPK